MRRLFAACLLALLVAGCAPQEEPQELHQLDGIERTLTSPLPHPE